RTGLLSAEIVELWGEECILAAMEDLTESRQLEREILTISEQERQKIAMELHDDLCPQLIGIEVMIKILKEKLETKDIAEAKTADKIRSLILDSINKTRRLSQGLFPINLSEHGLAASLEDLVVYIQDIFGISCKLTCDFYCPCQDNSVTTHLYYIAHEAVHNCVKHAKAQNIHIRLTRSNEKIKLTIKDDGKGISGSDSPHGLGIKIMKYRASKIGASFEIFQDPEGGTLVELELELEKEYDL
ncbi:MAG: diguanylate cyclase, partial [Proteobacteria bacterium]|nr:diguanylate cyclase [Pseudomonadota bacterium]